MHETDLRPEDLVFPHDCEGKSYDPRAAYFITPQFLLSAVACLTLSVSARWLMAVLLSTCDRHFRLHASWHNRLRRSEIALLSGVKARTLSEAFKELQSTGIILYEPGKGNQTLWFEFTFDVNNFTRQRLIDPVVLANYHYDAAKNAGDEPIMNDIRVHLARYLSTKLSTGYPQTEGVEQNLLQGDAESARTTGTNCAPLSILLPRFYTPSICSSRDAEHCEQLLAVFLSNRPSPRDRDRTLEILDAALADLGEIGPDILAEALERCIQSKRHGNVPYLIGIVRNLTGDVHHERLTQDEGSPEQPSSSKVTPFAILKSTFGHIPTMAYEYDHEERTVLVEFMDKEMRELVLRGPLVRELRREFQRVFGFIPMVREARIAI